MVARYRILNSVYYFRKSNSPKNFHKRLHYLPFQCRTPKSLLLFETKWKCLSPFKCSHYLDRVSHCFYYCTISIMYSVYRSYRLQWTIWPLWKIDKYKCYILFFNSMLPLRNRLMFSVVSTFVAYCTWFIN